ncbi:MAG: group 1 truncated hemoglobin [Phycisphaerae bacterium]
MNTAGRLLGLSGALLVIGAALAGCDAGGGMYKSSPPKSLYERLGGEPAIKAVCEDFLQRALANPKLNLTRKGTAHEWDPSPRNVERLNKLVVQFVCMATGGPQKYEGRDMKTAHHGMRITEAEFGMAAEDLIASLNKFNVPKSLQDELIALVATTKKDIVEMK